MQFVRKSDKFVNKAAIVLLRCSSPDILLTVYSFGRKQLPCEKDKFEYLDGGVMSETKRPTVATVFGVLNIVFGGFAVLSVFTISTLFEMYGTVGGIINIISIVVSVFGLYNGLLLLTNKNNALLFNQIQAFLSIIVAITWSIFLVASGFSIVAGMFSIVLGVLYPVLLIFLVVRNANVKSFYGSR